MDIFNTHNELFSLVIIPLLIILARICDVSLGTVRVILIGKGYRLFAASLGFFEVLIWITAISQIMQNLNNPLNYLAYAFGFSSGTYLGMVIENKLSIGMVMVRIITKKESTLLLERLLILDYQLTMIEAEGRLGDSRIIFLVMKRKAVPELIDIIKTLEPDAFYTIEDVRYVNSHQINSRRNSISTKIQNLKRILTVRK
jgi:uncharacterized protein YebE (UPF0316 family)